ncbi:MULTISPECIES: DNA ligase [Pseudoalteromonas]|uniref:DNA ligase (ATP) n=1 Tax=Pseudoalteromonas aurantia 208 TaxID=1314867 RepID=A0ABR9EHD0_9GAMM|nr:MULTISPECIES: DNA ligase [Pseudoalteromonas]MBE0369153.1 DNA ligase (ATP) [Pseudoalteromonas aurantia 208]MBQ4844475.1 DNA ligase [Pseudoalteromonas sp. MMG005]
MSIKRILWVVLFLSFSSFSASELPTSVQLAKRYQAELPVSFYHISEKYDGVRAIWDGKQLKTRGGNIIYAPRWFTNQLPERWLDGELWAGYNNFAYVSSLVRRRVPNNENWRQITYMVFDAPNIEQPFSQRYQTYSDLIDNIKQHHVKAVIQHRFEIHSELERFFNKVIRNGGEGVMLHLSSAKHSQGRSGNLLKYKPYQDAEAKVIAHLPGKGRYKGKTGALLVQTDSGIEFKIGSGLSDNERAHPPKIGTIVTFRHQGFTKYGKPRFAVFIRPKTTF